MRPPRPFVALLSVLLLAAAPAAADPAAGGPPYPTTDGRLALANLEAQIAALERRAGRGEPESRARLVELLLARAQHTGGVADRERALALAEALVAAAPADGRWRLLRARARGGLHQFAAALADVEAAAATGAPAAAVAAGRAGVLQSLGRYDEALALRRAAAAAAPSTDTLGALAALHAERGEIDAAAAAFADARAAYRDVSPFAIAWLLFDEGLMWMRHGQPGRARTLFAEAQRRLPAHAAAACHLAEVEAELGDLAAAVARLAPLAARSEDPDPAAHLARLLAARGDASGAAAWRRVAAERFEALLARHPAAFADHGAEFYLAAGADPQRALALAQLNLGVRRTAAAYALLVDAAAAAGRPEVACRALADLDPGSAPSLRDLRAGAACG